MVGTIQNSTKKTMPELSQELVPAVSVRHAHMLWL